MNEAQSNTERIVLFLDANDHRSWEAATIADRLGLTTNTVRLVLSELKNRDIVRYESPCWMITDNEERLRAAYRIHGQYKNADTQYGEERLEELRTDDMEEVL